MASEPPNPTSPLLPFASVFVVTCTQEIATKLCPSLLVLGITDPNRTVEQRVLSKTFDVKYKLGIKYNERERLGSAWKPQEGEWKKWITTKFRLVRMYAGDTFSNVISNDISNSLKTILDVSSFKARKPVKENPYNSPEPLIYEYRLPTFFKVRVEINPYHPMFPPLNLHKSSAWGQKTRELIRDCINGASTRHVRLLAQGSFRIEDKVAELPIETYLADPRPLPRNVSNDDLIKEEKDRLTKAIRDTRHPTPYKLALTIDWPFWCKTEAESEPSLFIEDMPMTIPEDDYTSHAIFAYKTISETKPKPAAISKDDFQHEQSATAAVEKEAACEVSEPVQGQASTKVPPSSTLSLEDVPAEHIKSTTVAAEPTRNTPRHFPSVHNHPSPKLPSGPAPPLVDLPAPPRHGYPSAETGVAVKFETNTQGRHSTPTSKPQKLAHEHTSATLAAPATAASITASSGTDRLGAMKIIWGMKDRNNTITNLGTSKKNCRACGAKMSSFVVLLDHLKSDQTHPEKSIKVQYWGDGQTVNVWILDLPAQHGKAKLFKEDRRGVKWRWLDDEA